MLETALFKYKIICAYCVVIFQATQLLQLQFNNSISFRTLLDNLDNMFKRLQLWLNNIHM